MAMIDWNLSAIVKLVGWYVERWNDVKMKVFVGLKWLDLMNEVLLNLFRAANELRRRSGLMKW